MPDFGYVPDQVQYFLPVGAILPLAIVWFLHEALVFDGAPEPLDQGYSLVDQKRLEGAQGWKDPLLPEGLGELSWRVTARRCEGITVQARVCAHEKVGQRGKNPRRNLGLRSSDICCKFVWIKVLLETTVWKNVVIVDSTIPLIVPGRRDNIS
jgi:hypothetical protein